MHGCIGNLSLLANPLRPPRQTGRGLTDRKEKEHGMVVQAAVRSQFKSADITTAVPNMLEILPRGINKWVGMQLLLQDLKVCFCLPKGWCFELRQRDLPQYFE